VTELGQKVATVGPGQHQPRSPFDDELFVKRRDRRPCVIGRGDGDRFTPDSRRAIRLVRKTQHPSLTPRKNFSLAAATQTCELV
jgi:hypothetical protein